ncbi:hypothetical protein [Vallitalea guaymasensis]|uniref:Uncharacterized protein n=1 Tax=Vallitalea guaymasensis TaxID=1185412 RepID=A0A8J8M994_9FIRM|nr:hypothetical protein [Vallitalea guaymasensis]QUH28558.1 hypothetical protein HYG85_06330 [Vallitalea guaymasensis]
MNKLLYILIAFICIIVVSCSAINKEEIETLDNKLKNLEEKYDLFCQNHEKTIGEYNNLIKEVRELNEKNLELRNKNNDLVYDYTQMTNEIGELIKGKQDIEDYYNNIILEVYKGKIDSEKVVELLNRFDEDTVKKNDEIIGWTVVNYYKDSDYCEIIFQGDKIIKGKLEFYRNVDTYLFETQELEKLPIPYYSKVIEGMGLGIVNLDGLLNELGDNFYNGIEVALRIKNCTHFQSPVSNGINVEYTNLEKIY